MEIIGKIVVLLHPISGCSTVRLVYLLWEQGVASSNPATPTKSKGLIYSRILRRRVGAMEQTGVKPGRNGFEKGEDPEAKRLCKFVSLVFGKEVIARPPQNLPDSHPRIAR